MERLIAFHTDQHTRDKNISPCLRILATDCLLKLSNFLFVTFRILSALQNHVFLSGLVWQSIGGSSSTFLSCSNSYDLPRRGILPLSSASTEQRAIVDFAIDVLDAVWQLLQASGGEETMYRKVLEESSNDRHCHLHSRMSSCPVTCQILWIHDQQSHCLAVVARFLIVLKVI